MVAHCTLNGLGVDRLLADDVSLGKRLTEYGFWSMRHATSGFPTTDKDDIGIVLKVLCRLADEKYIFI